MEVTGMPIPPFGAVDAAFGGSRVCIRPYDRNNMPEPEAIFNKLQSGARMVIEQAWGLLVNKFQCLSSRLRL